MEGSVAGVRILPAVVQFHDAEPGVLHQMNLKVQNLSKFSKSVRFHAPQSKVNAFNLIYELYCGCSKLKTNIFQLSVFLSEV